MAVVHDETPDDPDLSLHDLKLALEAHARGKIENALAIARLIVAGHRPAEIRAALRLSARDYATAYRWVREAVAAMRDDSPDGGR
jgi:hypothetical protein